MMLLVDLESRVMGYLSVAILVVVLTVAVSAVVFMLARRRPGESETEPERPEEQGTSYEEPQEEGPI